MINTLSQVQFVRSNLERTLATVAADPSVERQTDYYRENIRNIKSIDEFLGDDTIYRYAMKAMGLEDMIYAKAFMRKVLSEGVGEESSFANRLADTRYKAFAETFNFEKLGAATTSFSRTQEGIVDKFMRQTLEIWEGDKNQGVRLALYFERRAADITNPYDILADPALAETVYTALGLPSEFGLSDIDKQAAYLEERIEFDKLSDGVYLSKFLSRFSALYDLTKGPQAVNLQTLQVFANSARIVPMSEGLISSLQSFRLGGR